MRAQLTHRHQNIAFATVVRFSCVKDMNAQVIHSGLFGLEVGTAAARAAAHRALDRATRAVVRLDAAIEHHRLAAVWRRHEAAVGLAQALREAGEGMALDDAVRVLVTGGTAHDAAWRGAFEARMARWGDLGDRAAGRELRGIVRGLAPADRQGRGGLVDLAEASIAALARCAAPHVDLDVDRAAETAVVRTSAADAPDAGDVALATPLALRRLGVCRTPLPAVTGRPRVLAIDAAAIERASRWAESLEQQAGEGLERLRNLERYMARVTDALSHVRRPQALQRAVELTLWHGRLWAAELARLAGIDIANAWRCLAQAEDFGLLVAIPTPRGRGGGRMFTVPFLTRPGWAPVSAKPRQAGEPLPNLGASLAEFDTNLAAVDRLLARYQ